MTTGFTTLPVEDAFQITGTRQRVLVVGYGSGCGGDVYEAMIAESLATHFDVRLRNMAASQSIPRWLRGPVTYGKLARSLSGRGSCDIAVKTFNAALFKSHMPKRSIVVVHHLGAPNGIIYAAIERQIMKQLSDVGAIVVVSDYWNQRLLQLGFRNVHKIYNGFRTEEFVFQPEEIDMFKRRWGLLGKPILYLGNWQKHKGSCEAFEALQALDVHFVASGHTGSHGRLRCMFLDRREYLCLLKASTVVITMSQFEEGWCRTAHESMLCGTPVVGSGKGGMKELLWGGGQIICASFSGLSTAVELLLHNEKTRAQLIDTGSNYARRFTFGIFQKAWINLATDVLNRRLMN
jgi:glycosyltransferase involved in cell wall biosynthesis